MYELLRAARVQVSHHILGRLRHKVELWNVASSSLFNNCAGLHVRRLQRCLCLLGQPSPPRVWSACFRTVWNGWVTGHRFQENLWCPFCDSKFGKDSLVHISHCQLTRRVFHLTLREPLADYAPYHFFASSPISTSPHLVVLRALCTYALYKLHCSIKHGYNFKRELPSLLDREKAVLRTITTTALSMPSSTVRTQILRVIRGSPE